MSSNEYWAELQPERRLRHVVVASSAALFLAGLCMVCRIDVSVAQKLAGGIVWSLVSAWRLWQVVRAYARNGSVRLHADGSLEVEDADGRRHPASLCSGSFASQRIAWLRVSSAGGDVYGELVRGSSRESEEWRRFQVIWRHIGAHS